MLSRVVFSEHGLKSLRSHFVEEALDGSACCLRGDGDLVRLDVSRWLRRWWRGRRCLGPRLEVDVWDRAAGHSLVRALAVEVVDVVDVHRSILMSVHITTTISIMTHHHRYHDHHHHQQQQQQQQHWPKLANPFKNADLKSIFSLSASAVKYL